MKTLPTNNIVILSPHFDDAILSTGELMIDLAKTGHSKIVVVNVFTKATDLKNPLTDRLVKQSGLKSYREYFQSRRHEDAKSIESWLGGKAKILDLGFIDAAWRKNQAGQALYPKTTWGIVRAKEDDIIEEKIINEFIKICNGFDHPIIFAPVGRGKEHVDHLLVRDAAKRVFRSIIYYADYDYKEDYPLVNDFSSRNELTAYPYPQKNRKIRSLMSYKTQLKALFGDNVPKNLSQEIYYAGKDIAQSFKSLWIE